MGVGHGLVFRRAQVGQQRGHLVEGPPAYGLMIPASTNKQAFSSVNAERRCCGSATPVAGQVLANPLLVVPQQAVQGQDVAVADEGQTVVD